MSLWGWTRQGMKFLKIPVMAKRFFKRLLLLIFIWITVNYMFEAHTSMKKKIIKILREYLNGFVAARGKFLSIFICICKGEYDALLGWPFCHRISFTLVDQCQDPAARRNVTYSIKPNIIRDNKAFLGRPIGERNASFGAQKFVELEVLKEKDYIRDDCVFIKCTIDSDDMILL